VLAIGEANLALAATAEAGLDSVDWYAYKAGETYAHASAVLLGTDEDGGDTSYVRRQDGDGDPEPLPILDGLDLATYGHNWEIVAVATNGAGSTASTAVAVTVERMTLVRDWMLADGDYNFPTNYWRALGSTPGLRYGRRVIGRGNGAGGTAAVGGGGGGAVTHLDEVGTTAQAVAVAGIAVTAGDTDATDVTWGTTAVVAKGGLSGGNGGTGGQAAACTPSATAFSGGNGVATGGTDAGGASAGIAGNATGPAPGEHDGAVGITTANPRFPGAGGRSTATISAASAAGLIEVIYYTVAPRGFARVLAEVSGRHPTAGSTDHTIAIPAVSHVPSDSLGRLVVLAGLNGANRSASIPDYAALTPASDGSFVSLAAMHKAATGSDSTAMTLSDSDQSAWRVLRIVAYDGSVPPAPEWTTASGSSVNPDSPDHTPSGGSDDYLWISAMKVRGSINHSTATPPASFAVNRWIPTRVNTATLGSAMRFVLTDHLDPGAWTTGNAAWVAGTMSIAS
jgi:hypothetical protein